MLQRIHVAFYKSAELTTQDVRPLLAAEKRCANCPDSTWAPIGIGHLGRRHVNGAFSLCRRVLAGCVVVFSSVFRQGIAPHDDFHGRLALQVTRA